MFGAASVPRAPFRTVAEPRTAYSAANGDHGVDAALVASSPKTLFRGTTRHRYSTIQIHHKHEHVTTMFDKAKEAR